MGYSAEEVTELKTLFGPVEEGDEGGIRYLRIADARLPNGCSPVQCTLLLCPAARDGYPSRLFFSVPVTGPRQLGWKEYRILEHAWYAYSWQAGNQKRLAQILSAHLEALR